MNENEKKRLNLNCRKREYEVVSKRGSPAGKLQTGDLKIKQVHRFKYLGNVQAYHVKSTAKSEVALEQ